MEKLWPYIKKVLSGSIAQPTKQEKEVLDTPNLFQSIAEISLYNFLNCHVHGKLSYLIISGKATQEQLENCWQKLYEDYVYAIGDNEQRLYLRLYREVAELATKIHVIRRLIEILYNYRVKAMENMLNEELKTNINFDPSKPAEYDKSLQKCYNKSKGLIIQYDLKNIQLKSIEKNQNKGKNEKPTWEYFAGMINVLRIIHKCPLDMKVITPYDYIDLIRLTNKMDKA